MTVRTYTPAQQRADAPPVVRIERNEMSFNAAALALLGDPAYLVLGWDDTQRTIHITPLGNYETGALKVERTPHTGRIRCRGFLRFAGLRHWRDTLAHSPVLSLCAAPDGAITAPLHDTGAATREESTDDAA